MRTHPPRSLAPLGMTHVVDFIQRSPRIPGMFIALVRNEMLKVLRRRRFAIVIAILVAILSVVSYAQYRQLRNQKDRNWRAELQQRIAVYNNQMRRAQPDAPWARSLRAYINRLQFYLDHDIEPDKPTAPYVVRGF